MTSILANATLSRTDVALKALLKATDRIRHLEVEEQAAFAEYAAARELCADVGLACDLTLTPGMAASFADYKQRQAVGEARTIARLDAERDGHAAT